MPTANTIGFWTGITLLVVLSASGLHSAIGLDPAETAGQQIAIATQCGYALAGLLAAGGLVGRRRWARWMAWLWAGFITLTAGLAPVVWTRSTPGTGLAAGLLVGAIAALVVWLTSRRDAV